MYIFKLGNFKPLKGNKKYQEYLQFVIFVYIHWNNSMCDKCDIFLKYHISSFAQKCPTKIKDSFTHVTKANISREESLCQVFLLYKISDDPIFWWFEMRDLWHLSLKMG